MKPVGGYILLYCITLFSTPLAANPQNAVAMVRAKDGPTATVSGAGIVFGMDNTHIFIATAAHNAINDGPRGRRYYQDLEVQFRHRGGHWYPAEMVSATDPNLDLTALKVSRAHPGLNAPKFDTQATKLTASAQIGRRVIGIGSPNWRDPDNGAYVSDLNTKTNLLIVASEALREGFSGGGLFTSDGTELIGMIRRIDGDTIDNERNIVPIGSVAGWFHQNNLPINVPGLSSMLAAPTKAYQEDVWNEGPKVSLGISVNRHADEALPGNILYEVTNVTGPLADQIRPGDRISKVNRRRLPSSYNWQRDVLAPLSKQGNAVTLSIRRSGANFVTRCENRKNNIFCR